jgi:hypothetical protein
MKKFIILIALIFPTAVIASPFVGTGIAYHAGNEVNTFFFGYEFTDATVQYSIEDIYLGANQEPSWESVSGQTLSVKYHPTQYEFGKPFVRVGSRIYNEIIEMKVPKSYGNVDTYISLGADIVFYKKVITSFEAGSMGKGFYSDDRSQVFGHGFFSEVSIRYQF